MGVRVTNDILLYINVLCVLSGRECFRRHAGAEAGVAEVMNSLNVLRHFWFEWWRGCKGVY